MTGYVTALPAFVRGKLPAREASSFYDFCSIIFEKWPLAISPYISPFWLEKTCVCLDVLNKFNYI